MIVAVSGVAGSGKDTFSDYLVVDHGFCRLALADPLKRFCQEVFGFTDRQLWGPSEARSETALGSTVTARRALQTLGTDWGRALDEDVWAKMGARIARQKSDAGKRVVVTDVRFANELAALQREGAITVRVRREAAGLRGLEAEHVSEREQLAIADGSFDFVVDNDGPLAELREWAARVARCR